MGWIISRTSGCEEGGERGTDGTDDDLSPDLFFFVPCGEGGGGAAAAAAAARAKEAIIYFTPSMLIQAAFELIPLKSLRRKVEK